MHSIISSTLTSSVLIKCFIYLTRIPNSCPKTSSRFPKFVRGPLDQHQICRSAIYPCCYCFHIKKSKYPNKLTIHNEGFVDLPFSMALKTAKPLSPAARQEFDKASPASISAVLCEVAIPCITQSPRWCENPVIHSINVSKSGTYSAAIKHEND